MRAKITTEGDCVIVHLIGTIDVETALPFRRACLEQLTDKKVVFNFRELSFVGSSGILSFLETMQDFANTNTQGMKFACVGTEFRKILAATSLGAIEIHETESLAVGSFARMVAETPVTGVVPAPRAPERKAAPKMPPMQVRAVTEGINPIFLAAAEEADTEAGDADAGLDADGAPSVQAANRDDV